MGTSSSSDGSPSNVPIVPPWTPPPLPPEPAAGDQSEDEQGAGDENGGDEGGQGPDDADNSQNGQPHPLPSSLQLPGPIAPAARFADARFHLGRFATSGSADSMRRGLGHYVHKGLQGSGNAVLRFGGTTRTAGSLYDTLSALASGQAAEPGRPFDRALLAGKSAHAVMAAIIEVVRPSDGTQDAEAARDAMQRALAAMLEQFPDADLLELSEQERLFAIERYLALDVFNRACLDLGKAMMENAPSAASALSRMKDLRDYIRETVAAQFRRLRAQGQALSARIIARLSRDALRETFQVFEVNAI
jgi:hypothetical protein